MRRLYSSPITHGRPIIYYLPRVKIAEETTRGAHSNNAAPCLYIRASERSQGITGALWPLALGYTGTRTSTGQQTVTSNLKKKKIQERNADNVNNYHLDCYVPSTSSFQPVNNSKRFFRQFSRQFVIFISSCELSMDTDVHLMNTELLSTGRSIE